MSADDTTKAQIRLPNEITPEEAKVKRKYYLALASENANAACEQDSSADDTSEAMLATFILPGD